MEQFKRVVLSVLRLSNNNSTVLVTKEAIFLVEYLSAVNCKLIKL